jgi:dolichol-phosphate mannosyltransferase
VLSIIIPTYNEADNIYELIERVFGALSSSGISGEMIIVDDNSPDNTAEVAEKAISTYPIKVIKRKGKLGLSSAVLDGLGVAGGDTVAVMDADLSHPPEALPQMFELIEKGDAEIVVGSRLVSGGGVSNWPWYRRFVSWSARSLSWPLTRVKDSTSGFIMFKKSIIAGINLNPIGFKIGLEILARAKYNKVAEFPIKFTDRKYGESKLSSRPILEYLKQVSILYAGLITGKTKLSGRKRK